MKGRILLVAVALLLVASVANAQLFKFPVTRAGASIGDVVDATGALATYGEDAGDFDAYGIVVQIDGDDMLVASSGMFPYSGTAGTEYTTIAGTLVDRSTLGTDDAYPVVAVQMTADAAMIVMKNYEAREVEYTFTEPASGDPGFLGVVDADPNTVQDALDQINTYLSGLSSTLDLWLETTGPTNLTGTFADIATITHTPTTDVPAIATGDDIFVTFTGEFDDNNGVNGGHVQVQFHDGGALVGSISEIYLLDRDYFQTESVAKTLRITALASATNTWAVQAQYVAPYSSARFIRGEMRIERF